MNSIIIIIYARFILNAFKIYYKYIIYVNSISTRMINEFASFIIRYNGDKAKRSMIHSE